MYHLTSLFYILLFLCEIDSFSSSDREFNREFIWQSVQPLRNIPSVHLLKFLAIPRVPVRFRQGLHTLQAVGDSPPRWQSLFFSSRWKPLELDLTPIHTKISPFKISLINPNPISITVSMSDPCLSRWEETFFTPVKFHFGSDVDRYSFLKFLRWSAALSIFTGIISTKRGGITTHISLAREVNILAQTMVM